MKLETLRAAMVAALKEKNMTEKTVISEMIDAVNKASMTNKGRIEITEELVDATLVKYQKSVQEQVDTCPETRTDLREKYENELEIVKRFAPQMITDPVQIEHFIKNILFDAEIGLEKKNRGQIMKLIMPKAKGHYDTSIVNQIIGTMLK